MSYLGKKQFLEWPGVNLWLQNHVLLGCSINKKLADTDFSFPKLHKVQETVPYPGGVL